MNDIFFQTVSKKILLSLATTGESYVSKIANEIEGTYAHTFNVIKKLEQLEVIRSKKKGRTKYIRLTPKGEILASIINDFEETLKQKKVKKLEKTTKTYQTLLKLSKYKDSLDLMLKNLKNKKISRKEVGNKSRALGRYKYLTLKLNPKDKEGKKLKSEVLARIKEISDILREQK
jgi:predicted transcriptional regulator